VETDKERASEIKPKDVSTKFKKENKNSWYHSLVTKHKQTMVKSGHVCCTGQVEDMVKRYPY